MDADTYFTETEPAVRHMFDALEEYDALTVPPSLAKYADSSGVVLLNQNDAMEYLQDLSDSHALEFAKATLCGSIAQVAHQAIRLYSRNQDVDNECGAALGVKPNTPTAKFCIGRRFHGIPVGLLVYAARVQYNHWDEGKLNNPVAEAIFDRLRRHYHNEPTFDMAYVWNSPQAKPVSHYILRYELRWMSYDGYLRDMREALKSVAQ